MKHLAIILMLLMAAPSQAWWGSSSDDALQRYPEVMEEVLKRNPERAAQNSIRKGDYSLLLVPDCFMGMPGHQGKGPPNTPPKILGKTCKELFGVANNKDINKLKEWARKYNIYIQKHRNASQPVQ